MDTRTFKDKNLTLALVEGDLSIEWLRSLRSRDNPRPTNDVIFLCRNVSSSMTNAEAKNFGQETNAEMQTPGSRTCWVIDSKVAFGVARIFTTYAANAGSMHYYVCSDLEDAARWLDIDEDFVVSQFDELIQSQ